MTNATLTLEQIAAHAHAAGRIALDTEFMGEGRYRTLLCLIQLAVADTLTGTGGSGDEHIQIVDPLAGAMAGEPLARVLEDPQTEVVVHAGRQDIALLRRAFDCDVRNVFDTQVAAGFLGMPAQCSYDTLLVELLGVRLAKSASFTRWDARPLSAEQLSYAREDVVHLSALATELEHRLEQAGRLQWAREECEFLERVNDERDLDAIFARLPRIRGMNAAAQGVARELVAWRERTAAERDRPVQSVLGDTPLVEIAKRKPSSLRKLEEIRGVGQGSLRKRGEELLIVVQKGLEELARATRGRHAPGASQARRRTADRPLGGIGALTCTRSRSRLRAAGFARRLAGDRGRRANRRAR